jgi:peroxiredoxin Q/BCP
MSSLLLAVALAGLPLGAPVPDFSAPNQDGQTVRLSQFKGHPVLVYFYPKDGTSGCTKEACALRDRSERFVKAGAVILGISRQDAASHREFKAAQKLPFDLLTDADGSIAQALGVETYALVGIHKRQSVLIAADGTLLRFYGDVDPQTHADEVLADLARATAPTKTP